MRVMQTWATCACPSDGIAASPAALPPVDLRLEARVRLFEGSPSISTDPNDWDDTSSNPTHLALNPKP